MTDPPTVGWIDWTRPMLERYKKAYSEAVVHGDDNFDFDSHTYYVGYAKYLIEYLDARLTKEN